MPRPTPETLRKTVEDLDFIKLAEAESQDSIDFMGLTGDRVEAYAAGAKYGIGLLMAFLRDAGLFVPVELDDAKGKTIHYLCRRPIQK